MPKQNNQIELFINAERSSWSVSSQHGSEVDRKDKKMVELRKKILERDNYVCQSKGCGWHSERWQEVHPIDQNHRNLKEENWVTLCPLCHQVFHLPQAASTGGGALIWFPEADQGTLNLLCIGLFIAMKNPKSEHATIARSIYSEMEGRRLLMENIFGTSDPGLMAQLLIHSPSKEIKKKVIKHVRLLPYAARFLKPVEYWASVSNTQTPESTWKTLLPEHFNFKESAAKNR